MKVAPTRKIIHIDMDCFFVAVEIRNNPSLQGKPVAVGGQPGKRGVIATCNYEARAFGVRSAMASATAKRLCPELIILPSNMADYKRISNQVRDIFSHYTDKIEPLSLDEAYLDVTEASHCQGSATLMAQAIREEIREQLQLTASAGVGPNKLIAKIASDINKPDGLCVIPPDRAHSFISRQPVAKLFGVGKATQAKLKGLQVETCADLQKIDQATLYHDFGKFGLALYHYCRGIDSREVKSKRIRKSLSVETTLAQDLPDTKALRPVLLALLSELEQRLNAVQERNIKTLFVKLKFTDFKQTTAEAQAQAICIDHVERLAQKAYQRFKRPIRLIGIGVSFAEPKVQAGEVGQLSLKFE